MKAATFQLHWKQEARRAGLIGYEEARVIRKAHILSGLHNGMTWGMRARALPGDPKTVRNVAHVFIEDGLDAAPFDEEKSGPPNDFDDRERSRIIAMVCTAPPVCLSCT